MIQFIIGLIVGANVSLFLYACILAGAKADAHIENEGGNNEWRKSNQLLFGHSGYG